MADDERSDITIHIEQKLEEAAEAPVTNELYQVPDEIRKLNDDAYNPKVVSIGHIHHDKPRLRKMEIHKRMYFKEFLERSQANLDSLVRRVEELLSKPHYRYLKVYKKRPFWKTVMMIVVDAGFIFELFFQYCGMHRATDDASQLKGWLLNSMIRDLYLLENQLPFPILEELYNLATATPKRAMFPTFLQLTLHVFRYHNKQKLVPESATICHFTDLLRTLYLLPSQRQPLSQEKMKTNPHTVSSVTELHDIGVKFKADKTSQCLLDLQFSVSDRLIQIPQLIVLDQTEMLFGNMIALEQCYYPHEQHIMDYIFLLSCLIKTDEDVDILVQNGIIVNLLDHSNHVTRLFYNLGKNIPVIRFSSAYNQLCQQLNDFCEDRKMRMVTTLRQNYYLDLKRNYCKTPLQTLATLGGIFLLVLTVIQAVCSILQLL